VNDLVVVRLLVALLLGAVAFFLEPFALPGPLAALAGFAFGLAFILLEIRVKRISLKRLIGGGFGALLGILVAFPISLVISHAKPNNATSEYFELAILALLIYVGISVGASKGELLNLGVLGDWSAGRSPPVIPSTSWIQA
jgi:hypothetical protein